MTVRNNPSATYWNADEGYRPDVNDRELYPYRLFGSTLSKSLEIKTNIILDFTYQYCGYLTPVFMLTLHRPDELPEFDKDFTLIPVENAVEIAITPEMTVTSEGLRNYEPQLRDCYLSSERRLRFFKSYSQRKCELECLADYMKKDCGCVRFNLPRSR